MRGNGRAMPMPNLRPPPVDAPPPLPRRRYIRKERQITPEHRYRHSLRIVHRLKHAGEALDRLSDALNENGELGLVAALAPIAEDIRDARASYDRLRRAVRGDCEIED